MCKVGKKLAFSLVFSAIIVFLLLCRHDFSFYSHQPPHRQLLHQQLHHNNDHQLATPMSGIATTSSFLSDTNLCSNNQQQHSTPPWPLVPPPASANLRHHGQLERPNQLRLTTSSSYTPLVAIAYRIHYVCNGQNN